MLLPVFVKGHGQGHMIKIVHTNKKALLQGTDMQNIKTPSL